MHLIERYALATGSKIGKPFIVKKFYPIDAEKYITLQNSSGMPAKCYDYFQDVINLILPKLNENGYKIVQIGGQEDTALDGCIHLQGKTTINQTAYILDNSSLHLGNDSFAIHMCSAFNVPTVGLYSVTLPEIAGAYWGDKNIGLKPSDSHKPSFNPNESPKTVNLIKIEDIVSSVNKLLFNSDDLKIKTIFTGDRYKDKIIETTADQVIDINFFANDVLNIRLDYSESLTELEFGCMLQNIANRKCSIITNKPFNCLPFVQFKNNLTMVIYEVTNSADILFIDQMDKHGIPYICIFDISSADQDMIQERKFQLMEYCGIQEFNKIPNKYPNIENSFKFKTNRILLSNQKAYNSRSCHLEGISIDSPNDFIEISKLKNKQNLLEDLEFCLILEK
jgi:hypothetical protein